MSVRKVFKAHQKEADFLGFFLFVFEMFFFGECAKRFILGFLGVRRQHSYVFTSIVTSLADK